MQKSWVSSQAQTRRRDIALALLIFAPLAALLIAVPPIAQDPNYHAFADNRALLGVPNFANVASNAAFLAVGALGLHLVLKRPIGGARLAWVVFFGGTLLVSLGSGYYHWAPGDARLVWDRLPMTIAFMGLFVALMSEHLEPDVERKWLVPAILVGVASVFWWRHSGDLRFYVWVQLAPLLAIPATIAAFRGRYSHRAFLLYGLACYALAKVAEFSDGALFAMTGGTLSGHTLKHLLAALATFFVYLMLRHRKPLAAALPIRT